MFALSIASVARLHLYLRLLPSFLLHKLLPAYYIADGTANSVLSTSAAGQLVLDVGVSVAAVALLLLLAVWMLRRQATQVSIV